MLHKIIANLSMFLKVISECTDILSQNRNISKFKDNYVTKMFHLKKSQLIVIDGYHFNIGLVLELLISSNEDK